MAVQTTTWPLCNHSNRKLMINFSSTKLWSAWLKLLVFFFFMRMSRCLLFKLYISFHFLYLKTRRQGLFQIFCLLFVCNNECLEEPRAANLKFHIFCILLDLHRFGIFSSCFQEKILNFFNFTWHFHLQYLELNLCSRTFFLQTETKTILRDRTSDLPICSAAP